jgi:hypothetical protein
MRALYEEVHSGLVAFLARYGKTPSAKARANIRSTEEQRPAESEESNADTIVAMIIAKGLAYAIGWGTGG